MTDRSNAARTEIRVEKLKEMVHAEDVTNLGAATPTTNGAAR